MKKKIDARLQKLVLNQHKNNPGLGVRKVASLLEQRYGVTVSKSTVHKILKKKKTKLAKGRKPASLSYKQREVSDCGLILLSCIDSHIGIFDYLTDQLNLYLPRLPKGLIRKFIILASFSSFSGGIRGNIEKTGFLRLAGLNTFPAKKFAYFKERITKYKPLIDLSSVKKELNYVSTVKFIFNNGRYGLCDAKMSTLWDDICKLGEFFLPAPGVLKQVDMMLKNKLFVVGYTKSFGYLSLLAANFIEGLESGIKKIQLLDSNGKTTNELNCNLDKISYAVGYSPKALTKGVQLLNRRSKGGKFSWDELEEVYYRRFLCNLMQPDEKKGVILANVRIKRNPKLASVWSLLTVSGRIDLEKLVKEYLYRFPQMEVTFKRDLKVIEKSLFSESKKPELVNIFPGKLRFNNVVDFGHISQLLSAVFKEIVGGWEPRGKKGNFSKGKSYLKISLKKTPVKIRSSFNEACFYYQNKRVFIV